jgi:hypothetical protein
LVLLTFWVREQGKRLLLLNKIATIKLFGAIVPQPLGFRLAWSFAAPASLLLFLLFVFESLIS